MVLTSIDHHVITCAPIVIGRYHHQVVVTRPRDRILESLAALLGCQYTINLV